jgi:hypothetical protein
MWQWLKQSLSSGRGRGTAAAEHVGRTGFYVYRIRTPDGEVEVVSLVPPEQVVSEGLSAPAIIGGYGGIVENERDLVSGFRPNGAFLDLLHSLISAHAPALRAVQESARRQGSGEVLVIDGRTPTPDGEIPSRDIIGGFSVENGAIVPESYQPNPHHRLLTADGLFQLEPTLYERLIERIAASNPVGANSSSVSDR